jgi:LysM repeat protein
MSKIDIDKVLGNIGDKYDVTDHVIGMQHDPGDMVSTNFKQEYTVIIRKKKYYAITALEGNSAYLKMYQIDNFTTVSTSNSVNGTSPGTCRVSLVGGQRVICAERNEQDSTGWGAGEAGFFSMLSGWSSSIDDGTTSMDVNGDYLYNNILFDNIDDMKEAKYGWKIAEKCDIEPMDEIYVFGKSKREKDGDRYKVYQLFFGYISDVTKSFTADKSNPIIQISAVDHLKLLQISFMANTPALFYNVAVAGAHYDTDELGNLIIDDDPYDTDGNGTELKASPFTNVFAGRYPYEIISKIAEQAGIPNKFLQKRIEQVKRVPFIPTLKNGGMVEMFQTDVDNVLHYCTDAAEKLFMEFFADEEGNLVFKIPNWTLGVNKLSANNAYIDSQLNSDEKDAMTKAGLHDEEVTETVTTYETVTETLSNSVTHTVVSGDTLWDLASSYLGDSSRWNEIYDANRDKISDPHWIYPGQVLTIQQGSTNSKQVEKQQQITTKKQVMGDTLSSITDKYIPIVEEKEVISFVLTDSDSQVANCFEINQDAGQFGSSSTGDAGKMMFTRVVQDWASIIRFGMRKAKTVSTPLLDDVVGPVLFGTLMVQKALSQRYKGTLNMIEESSIRVGNPIRMFMYDEHPYKFNNNQLDNGPEQAVFYVESISRDIKPDGVSTMQLTLSAGRVMGMESTYDKMQLLYGRYYDEPETVEYTPPTSNTANGGSAALSGNYTENQAQIIEFAKQFLGKAYSYGGISPDTGFDCSGFTYYVYGHFGVNLPRTSQEQLGFGTEVSQDQAQPCDLFFPKPGHVGIYLGNNQVLHSPKTGDVVKISPVWGELSGYPRFRRVL